MLQRKIASRYAEALFDLAVQQGSMAKWAQELNELGSVLNAESDFRAVLTHPEIPQERKAALVNEAFAGRLSPEVLNLLLILLKREHDPDITLLAEIFTEKWNISRQVLPVTVKSAVALSEEQATRLAVTLAKRSGSRIELTRLIDPEIIAGLVITIGDRIIDASALNTLEELRVSMAGI